MTLFIKPTAVLVLAHVLLLSAGCGGSENDPCQQPDDCNVGLVCCNTNGVVVSGRTGVFGACRAEGSCTATSSDAGSDAGDAATDAATDAAMEDAAVEDAGSDASDGAADSAVDGSPSVDAG